MIVGAEKNRSYWHENLINVSSQKLQMDVHLWESRNSGSTATPTVKLPKTNLEHFHITTDWLYNRPLENNIKGRSLDFILSLYETAVNLELEGLENDLTDCVRKHIRLEAPLLMILARYMIDFQTTMPQRPMRHLLVAVFALRLACEPEEYIEFATEEPEYAAKLYSDPMIAGDLLMHSCQYRKALAQMPGISSKECHRRFFKHDLTCVFHNHISGSKCSAEKARK